MPACSLCLLRTRQSERFPLLTIAMACCIIRTKYATWRAAQKPITAGLLSDFPLKMMLPPNAMTLARLCQQGQTWERTLATSLAGSECT